MLDPSSNNSQLNKSIIETLFPAISYSEKSENVNSMLEKYIKEQKTLKEIREDLIVYSGDVLTKVKDGIIEEIIYGEGTSSKKFKKNIETLSGKALIEKAKKGFEDCDLSKELILHIENSVNTIIETAVSSLEIHRSKNSDIMDKRNSYKDISKAFEALNYRISQMFDYMLEEVNKREHQAKEIIYEEEKRAQEIKTNKKIRDVYMDPVVGPEVLTRRGLEEGLKDTNKESLKNTGAMIIDIDFFKSVNDTFGHPVGDLVIKEVGKKILGVLRGPDRDPIGHVARWGGEEFVVLLTLGENPDKELAAIAERIREAIKEFRLPELKDRTITVSCGYAKMDINSGKTAMDVLKSTVEVADLGLYEAKESGRDKCCSGEEALLKKRQKEEEEKLLNKGKNKWNRGE